MKYKQLPVEKEVVAIKDEKDQLEFRGQLVDQLIRHPGFQIVVCLLRDVEREAIHGLRNACADFERKIGHIETVERIRNAIAGIVPGLTIDWAEEELEEFMPPDIADF